MKRKSNKKKVEDTLKKLKEKMILKSSSNDCP